MVVVNKVDVSWEDIIKTFKGRDSRDYENIDRTCDLLVNEILICGWEIKDDSILVDSDFFHELEISYDCDGNIFTFNDCVTILNYIIIIAKQTLKTN